MSASFRTLGRAAAPTDELIGLLHHEADLLDAWRLDEWLELWHPSDCLYWVPIDETQSPDRCISIVYDDRLRMEERVYYLNEGGGASAFPRSRTVRAVSNVQIDAADHGWIIRSRQVIYELRTGDHSQIGLGETRVLPAVCEHRVVRRESDDGYAIVSKTILLLHRDQPFNHLMFIL